jgi:hypothetical protein
VIYYGLHFIINYIIIVIIWLDYNCMMLSV